MNRLFEASACALGFFRYRTFLRRSRRWSAAQMQDYQVRALRRTLQRAHARSSFYRKRLDQAGLDPASLGSLDEIRKLPLLRKEDVRGNFEGILSSRGKTFASPYRTSGSTGEPLRYWKSVDNIAWEFAFHMRYFAAAGAGPRDRMAALRTYVPDEGKPLWKKDAVFPVLWMSAYHLHEGNVADYVAAIRNFRANYLRGYPSSLYILARFCEARGISLPVRAAFSSSEMLSREKREVIERVLGCKVHEYYGLSENMACCFQCEEGDLFHVNPEYGLFEVIRSDGQPAGPGETGVIVGTGFHNDVFPFIRYWTGDLCRVATRACPCGWDTPVVESILGREDDLLVSDTGIPLPGVNFYSLFREFESVENFQIVQPRPDRMQIFLVPNDRYDAAEEEAIRRELHKRAGSGMQLEIRKVEQLRKNSIGKVRSLIREFPLEMDQPAESWASLPRT